MRCTTPRCASRSIHPTHRLSCGRAQGWSYVYLRYGYGTDSLQHTDMHTVSYSSSCHMCIRPSSPQTCCMSSTAASWAQEHVHGAWTWLLIRHLLEKRME